MSVIRKKQEEKNLKILRELLTFEGNRYCFDCNQRGPTYVNITIGSFVCTNCGGALRKYSHRLKSISMSNFSQTEMDFIKKRGNNICKKIYYGLCEQNIPPEMDIKNGMLDSHLRSKYELKKWYSEPSTELEDETVAQNQVIFDRVERGVAKPVKSYSVNSSSNIIIDPPKLTTNKLAATKGNKASIDLVENIGTFDTTSQPKSSITITNAIDPAKLGGGSAVKLPMSSDNKNSAWLSSVDEKPNHNTQSPFGDDFLFSSVKENTPISKSQTMNFSMPPLVPMSQGAVNVNAQHGTAYHGEPKGSDKYAALAELDDLFSNTSVGQVVPGVHVPAAFSAQWDSSNRAWYGPSNNSATLSGSLPPQPVATVTNPSRNNPFSNNSHHHHHHPATNTFNPFTANTTITTTSNTAPYNDPMANHWPANNTNVHGPPNPFTTCTNPFL